MSDLYQGSKLTNRQGLLLAGMIFTILLVVGLKMAGVHRPQAKAALATTTTNADYKTETVPTLKMERVGYYDCYTVERYPVEGGWVYVTKFDFFSGATIGTTFVPRNKP